MRYSVKDRRTGKEVGHIVAEDLETASKLFYNIYSDKTDDVFMTDDK
jgi:hypothetical protein